MAFLNTSHLKSEIEKGKLIDPYDPNRIKQGAYELSAAPEHYHTALKSGKQKTPDGEQISIPPGQLAILITAEKVSIPLDRIGFISIKFSVKVRGLINVSGFHVDPGFKGNLKFSVYNAGSRPIEIDPGEPLFTLWMSELKGSENDSTKYKGEHQGQEMISCGDVSQVKGYVASPGTLLREIKRIKSELIVFRVLGGIAFALISAAVLIPILEWVTEYWKPEMIQVQPGATAKDDSNATPLDSLDDSAKDAPNGAQSDPGAKAATPAPITQAAGNDR